MTKLTCTHGVALQLDKGHSCFECEKTAVELGIPLYCRQLDPQTFMRAVTEASIGPEPGPHPSGGLAISDWWRERYGTPEARKATRLAALRASEESDEQPDELGLSAEVKHWNAADFPVDGKPTTLAEITAAGGGPEEPAYMLRHERDALAAELKALQRLFLDQRRELEMVTNERDRVRKANIAMRGAMNEATACLQRKANAR